MKRAILAGGCFWCIAAGFDGQAGVQQVTAGYAGGTGPRPTYTLVKKQLTDYRESIAVDYDEAVVSYQQLLDIYFANIDPWDGEGQFVDRGRSYTLAIFYADDKERVLAHSAIASLEQSSGRKVQVELLPTTTFWEAEPEHQNYAARHKQAMLNEWVQSGRAEKLGMLTIDD